jgi:hypothetical protein
VDTKDLAPAKDLPDSLSGASSLKKWISDKVVCKDIRKCGNRSIDFRGQIFSSDPINEIFLYLTGYLKRVREDLSGEGLITFVINSEY